MAKILIVEDDQSNAEVIKLVLEGLNHKAVTIQDGALLDQAVVEYTPDLIVMDILLGNCDGRKLCNHLKQDVKTRRVPVLLLTAMLESQVDRIPSSPDAVMFKPFDYEKLNKVINSLIQSRPFRQSSKR